MGYSTIHNAKGGAVTHSHHDEFQELVSLSWVALGQAQQKDGAFVDEETARFFSSTPQSPMPPVVQRRTEELPVVLKKAKEAPMEKETAEEAPLLPSQTRRLEKLLPRPSACASSDTTAVRNKILSSSSSLSDVSLYKDPLPKTGPKTWTIFSHLTPDTPHETFVRSVATAIEERLQVRVCELSCTDPLFAVKLPMAVDDSEIVFLVVDAHLEGALQELLEPIHSFASSSQVFDPPFSVIGSINGNPLRTLVLHPSTHEDQTVKAQLWQSLKALATLNSPC